MGTRGSPAGDHHVDIVSQLVFHRSLDIGKSSKYGDEELRERFAPKFPYQGQMVNAARVQFSDDRQVTIVYRSKQAYYHSPVRSSHGVPPLWLKSVHFIMWRQNR
jgi:hypothetical protein